jgi:diguanylate cyclase (GGDEF)-like protein/PAS domain S-box-containing protein
MDDNYRKKSMPGRKRSEEELERYRQTLEELVAERTSELKTANEQLRREIAERKQAEEALRRSNRTMRMFSECNDALVHAVSESGMLDDICRNIVGIGGYSLAWVGFSGCKGMSDMTPVAWAGRRNETSADNEVFQGGGTRERCRVAEVLFAGRAAISSIERAYALWLEEGAPDCCYSAVAFPLKGAEGIFGVLHIHAEESDAFDTEEVKILSDLADELAYGIMSLRSGIGMRRAEDALRLRQRAVESSSNGIIITDAIASGNPVIYVNPAFERITGYAVQEVAGRNCSFLFGDDREQLGLEDIRAALREKREGRAVLRNYRRDGSLFWNDLSISPVRNESGKVTNFVGIINDITERKQYEEQLEYQAGHDTLTGLPNRNLLADRISQALSYAGRYRRMVAVLFTDLDNFKFINDSLGHDTGDQLLKIVTGRLLQCVRSIDTVARHSGDEFVVVIPDIAKSEEAADVARRIQEAVCRPFEIGSHELVVSCSIGISVFPRDGTDSGALLKNADVAMYRAKEQGRNNFQFYTAELNEKAVARMTMEKYLRRALERNEFLLHYQPQVDLADGRIIGAEALLRWRSPELGYILPERFIPLAEDTGLIVPIGEWVLRAACEQNKRWQAAGRPPLVMAVNLSPRHFRRVRLVETVDGILRETGLDPCFLDLEVIESLLLYDVENAMHILKKLKELGVLLTMDDFGTGYSSLGYLKRFPFDKIKIDRSFVRDITGDPDSAAIAGTIIALARNLDLRVIAEGVETKGQLEFLISHGCDEIQGFYFSYPLTAEEFDRTLRERRHIKLPRKKGTLPERTLLLVDDEENVAAALKRELTGKGYHVLTAGNAEQGFEMLAVNRVGVILCDQRMPGMKGTDFLSRVKKLYPDSIRILLTAYGDLETVTDALNRGSIFKFIGKPWESGMFCEIIREAFLSYESAGTRTVN